MNVLRNAMVLVVIAAKPTAPWDEKKGNPAGFVNRAYTTLKRL